MSTYGVFPSFLLCYKVKKRVLDKECEEAFAAKHCKESSMMDRPFAALLDLITFDQEMRVAYQEIEQLKHDIIFVRAQEAKWNTAYAMSKQRVHDLGREISQIELELRGLGEQEKGKKVHLENMSDYREYKAIKAEIDGLHRVQHDLEERLMLVYNKLEIAQKDFERERSEHDKRVKELSTSVRVKEDRIATLQSTLIEHDKHRPAKEQHVPGEWREKYTTMRLRVPDPVVPIMDGGCSACYHSITQQELIRLKGCELVQCQGCFRLMFLQQAMQLAESSSE